MTNIVCSGIGVQWAGRVLPGRAFESAKFPKFWKRAGGREAGKGDVRHVQSDETRRCKYVRGSAKVKKIQKSFLSINHNLIQFHVILQGRNQAEKARKKRGKEIK